MASTELNGLHFWEATNSGGEPVCVSSWSEEGLTLNVYRDEDGVIRGVEVYEVDGLDSELLTVAGRIPLSAVKELLMEDEDPWLRAEEVSDLYNEKFVYDSVGVS